MRRGRRERPPIWVPVLMSVFWSVVVTVVVPRWLARRTPGRG